MSYQGSRTGVILGARYDGIPWVEVIWREAPMIGGPYVEIDVRSVPIDATPDTPNPLNLTTTQRQLAEGWYTLQPRDADGVLGDETDPFPLPDAADDQAPLCTIEQINAQLARGQVPGAYSDDEKLDARSVATAAFEEEAGVAFSSRTTTRTLRESGRSVDGGLYLPDALVQSVTAVSRGGAAWTPEQLATLTLDGDTLYGLGTGIPVTVTYTHGLEQTPPDVSRAVAVLAASLLKDGPYDDRGFAVTDTAGSVRLMTAGIGGAAFSLPEVQAALNRHRHRSFLGT